MSDSTSLGMRYSGLPDKSTHFKAWCQAHLCTRTWIIARNKQQAQHVPAWFLPQPESEHALCSSPKFAVQCEE